MENRERLGLRLRPSYKEPFLGYQVVRYKNWEGRQPSCQEPFLVEVFSGVMEEEFSGVELAGGG